MVNHLGKEYLNLILVSTQGIPALVEVVPEEPNGVKLLCTRHTEGEVTTFTLQLLDAARLRPLEVSSKLLLTLPLTTW